MSGQPDNAPPRAAARGSRLALLLAGLALAGTVVQWLGVGAERGPERTQREELAKMQRRLAALEDRVTRERDDLGRLSARLGPAGASQEPLAARVEKLEDSLARMPGGERVRSAWAVDQAAYFLRLANAEESLAGDSASALKALEIADEHLREAADPRLLTVRKLIATEQAALRAVPAVDTEGLLLKLGTLTETVRALPLRQAATAFRPEAAPAPAELTGTARALQTLRNAFFSVVSVRRTGTPVATLPAAEDAGLVARSVELELQMARLALIRGEPRAFRAALAEARHLLTQYYDTGAGPGAGALGLLDAVALAPMPEALPDISASLAELNRFRERQAQP